MVGRLVSASMVKDWGGADRPDGAGRAGVRDCGRFRLMMVTDQICCAPSAGPPAKAAAARGFVMVPLLTVIAGGRHGGWFVTTPVARRLVGVERRRAEHAGRLDGPDQTFFLGLIVSIACHVGMRTSGGTRASAADHQCRRGQPVAVIAVDFSSPRSSLS
jgi:hypothetical protein